MRTVRALAILSCVILGLIAGAPLAQAADYVANYQVSVEATADTTITQFGSGTRDVTVTVTSQYAEFHPDGAVKFEVFGGPTYEDLKATQTISLSGGTGATAVAVYKFSSALGTGSYKVKTTYLPTSEYFGTRTTDTATITVLPRGTKVAGSASVASSTSSQTTKPVSLSAIVSPDPAGNASSIPTGGTVTFRVQKGSASPTTVGTSTVAAGGATNQTVTANLEPGTYTLLTKYTSGSPNYSDSPETSVTFTVDPAGTAPVATTTVGSAVNASTSRQVTLSTTVTPTGAPAPNSGTVSYVITPQGGGSSQSVGPVSVTGGTTPGSTVTLSPSTYTLVTTYSGGGIYGGSTETKTLGVGALPLTVGSVVIAKQGSNNIRVTPTLKSGATSLTRTVTVRVLNSANSEIASQTVTTGQQTGNLSAPAGGSYTVRVDFAGDAEYSGSSTPTTYNQP